LSSPINEQQPSKTRTHLSSGRYIQLGPIQIDQLHQEIKKHGNKVMIAGKVYELFMMLLERPGEVITKDEVRQRLWPLDTGIDYDANVHTTMNKLRMALGDSSRNPEYIETIARRGYCLRVRPEVTVTPKPTSPSVVGGKSGNQSKLEYDRWVVLRILAMLLVGLFLGVWITLPVSNVLLHISNSYNP
jgi:DNA-binding winged helix-turn-helix (wHTH) protein